MKKLYILPFLLLSLILNYELYAGFVEDTAFSSVAVGLKESAAAWGDYTNNGYWDLIMIGRDSSNARRTILYENKNGTFQRRENHNLKNVSLEPRHLGGVIWADLNNNGWLDLVVSGVDENYNANVRIYENTGGNFHLWQEITEGAATAIAAGDFNNDGLIDLAVGTLNRNEPPILYANTGGGFVKSGVQLETGLVVVDMVWVDLNNNGWLDLVTIGEDASGTPATIIYRNNGGISFDALVSKSGGPISEGFINGAIAVGDYNNNGWLDLAISGHTGASPATVIYTNMRTSPVITFSSSTFGLPGVYRSAMAFGDYNNDGRLDLAISGEQADLTSIMRIYSGASAFASYTDLSPGLKIGSVSWADITVTPGALDILVSGDSASGPATKLYINDVDSAPYEENNRPPPVPGGTMTSRYVGGKLYLMWNDPEPSGEETPVAGFYYNFRVGTTQGSGDLVPARYGSPMFGNYVTKTTSSTISTDANAPGIISEYKHVRVMSISGANYYWAVQTIDTGLGYTWAEFGEDSGWSEESVFEDDSGPEGIPGIPYTDSEVTYDKNLVFHFEQGTAEDPETGIYGCFVELTETDEYGVERIVVSEEVSDRLRQKVWINEKGTYEYHGKMHHTYHMRIKARHGYDQQIPEDYYVKSNAENILGIEGLWHPDTEHYTEWSEMSSGVKIIELLTLDRNLLRSGESIELSYALMKSGLVTIRVFNKLGELTATIFDDKVERGNERPVKWDGKDSSGSPIPSGLYFVNIQAPGGEDTQKVVAVR